MKPLISTEQLFADLFQYANQYSDQLPPVHLWNPEKSGDMDLRIDREGRWLHESSEIKKPAIVKLFSSLLKLEENTYYLVTPNEKWQIQVDIAPLYIIDAKTITREGIQAICLSTTTDEHILLGKDHPLIMREFNGAELPIVTVRNGLNGLISRSVFYQLVDWGQSKSLGNGLSELILESLNCQFSLGKYRQ